MKQYAYCRQRGLIDYALLLLAAVTAFSIPFYNDYARRTRVAEGLVLVTPAKVALSEYYAEHHSFPSGRAEDIHELLRLPHPLAMRGTAVSQVSLRPDGSIHVIYNEKVQNGAQVILTPELTEDRIVWHCHSPNITRQAWLPLDCRNTD